MAYERPVSRHGRHNTFNEIQVEGDPYVYQKKDCTLSRPKSSYKRNARFANNSDKSGELSDHERQDAARRNSAKFYQQSAAPEATPYHSDHVSSPSALSGSSESLIFTSPQPPQGKPSRHHVSGNRSSRQDPGDVELSESGFEGSRTTPDMSGSRPSSSFSIYRPLPAIGTPSGLEPDISHHFPPNNSLSASHSNDHDDHPPKPQVMSQPPKGQTASRTSSASQRSRNNNRSSHRIHSAVSDISVISKASSARKKSDVSVAAHLVERLDLSQMNKSADSGRRRKVGGYSSPLQKNKAETTHDTSKYDSAELYDGDDDDSDSYNDPPSEAKEVYQISHKKPVIIPSENGPIPSDADQSILLAVKLPTDGTRHQRYFQRCETLMAIIEFAEEQAGQDFAGYILVASAPKIMYEYLEQTIDEAGLEDKTVLHLEEND